MMEHNQAKELLPAYLDHELGITDANAVEHHLGTCPECQQAYEEQRSVRARLKSDAAYFKAPAHLAQRINNSLPAERARPNRFKGWNVNWLSAGAVSATLLALVWSGSLYLALPSAQDRLVEELVSSHVRSLQVDHLSDVVSSDQHTVKPWFHGKLDFAPPVVDLTPQGFPLVGGRLDYLNDRTVAVLVYRHGQHPINIYIWPSADRNSAPQMQSSHGYHLINWAAGGMNFWAVSDLATDELEIFVNTLRSQV